MRTKICKYCGSSFIIISRKRKEEQSFCSTECFSMYLTEVGSRRFQTPDGAECVKNLINRIAVAYHLMSPNGVEYKGRNVILFVCSNPHLFEPEDVLTRYTGPSDSRSRASIGLCRLTTNKKAFSWKGWKSIKGDKPLIVGHKPFKLVAPNGNIYEGSKVPDFVREYSHLFDPVDLVCLKKYGLPAVRHLYNLTRSNQKSWKGWTLVKD